MILLLPPLMLLGLQACTTMLSQGQLLPCLLNRTSSHTSSQLPASGRSSLQNLIERIPSDRKLLPCPRFFVVQIPRGEPRTRHFHCMTLGAGCHSWTSPHSLPLQAPLFCIFSLASVKSFNSYVAMGVCRARPLHVSAAISFQSL
jgi:hypothetical protein